MKFKNVIATGLITATLFGATMTAQAQTTKFNDVPSGHWSEGAISYLSDNGIVYGYGNGIYGFGDNVTRGQVASIMARYFKLQDNGSRNTYFTDIQNHPFEGNINAVIQAGIMKGDGTDKFRPDATLTRYEMSSVLQHAFDLAVKGNMPFNDIPSGHWAKEAIQALYTNGVTSGVGQNQYGGQYDVTREQFAKFMYSSIYKDQNQKPVEDNTLEHKVQNILTDYGFFKRENSYVYNAHGENGEKLFDVMRVQITPNADYEYRVFINSDDPSVNTAVQKMFNEILPTQGNHLYNIIDNSNVENQTLELDGRSIKINKGWNLSILVGPLNK
ncbi:S-layer homology domain-containing protein [Bacillus cereus group sp. BfR-BA-01363]|uniref:S-layer homology domain-containing protein n=1 Tax=Bacillus cereus group sp. BfR-BA-01363 TaxID=3094882 RepID=UPI0029C4C71A|nr:S-layer homology domain-containing protein [Bacillus cereus group sp. BfR-BA-01363]MDX5853099.1 S-layer homology domain-containing protein [Bacillus cereus group sp. BfR-BA-01363]